VLLDIASRKPRSASDLGRVRDINRTELESYGQAFLEAIAAGVGVPPEDRPSIFIPAEDTAEMKRLSEILWTAAQVICMGQSVTTSLVTSQSEIAAIARLVHQGKPFDRHPLMTSWHRECLGEKLAAFVAGTLEIDLTLRDKELRASFRTSS